ncbi:MAG: hypothetical protein AB7U85_07585 [Alphaproteobacteria bacterium]
MTLKNLKFTDLTEEINSTTKDEQPCAKAANAMTRLKEKKDSETEEKK